MSKTYKASVARKMALPRSKRLREGGTGSVSVSYNTGEATTEVSSQGGVLTQDILTDIAAGHIAAGQLLESGMTFTQFVRKFFTRSLAATLNGKISTGNDVEYGTAKGVITYTSTRNSGGVMQKAYMDGDKTKPLLFSEETDGVQIAVRTLEGIYTQGETYRATAVYEAGENGIPETTLESRISVNVHRRWFAGVCAAVPATSAQVRALSGSGLYSGPGEYKFTISNYRIFVICIPSGTLKTVSIESNRYQYNFMDLDSAKEPKKIQVEGAGGSAAAEYTMYVFRTTIASTETDIFKFRTI